MATFSEAKAWTFPDGSQGGVGRYHATGKSDHSERPYRYLKNCTEVACGKELRALEEMIDGSIEISYRTFFKYCDLEYARTMLGYEKYACQGLTLKGDWHITYHRSKFKGKRCYYLCHSSIEYIFIEEACRP